MFHPIVPSTSYPTISVMVTRRVTQEDRIDLMRFLFMGPTRTVSTGGQEDIGAIDDWVEEDSEVSVPELVADLDDSFLGLETAEQGKEATAVEETVPEAQGEDRIDQEPDMGFTEEAEEFEGEGDEDDEDNDGEWALPPARGAPSLSVKSLTLYRQLGEGGFGQVYAASLKGSDKVRAVKVIPKTEDNEDQVSREQDLLRRLTGCPFFPQLEASWQSNLNYYLVTPIYPGKLRDEIDKFGGLSIDVAHFYIKQILGAVDYLHTHYILHRDLKLENILLTQEGNAVVCDFGLATIVRPDGRARRSFEEDPHQRIPDFYIESQSYCFGTPQSTAPEIVLGETYGLPSDMWSLGVIIYEMITGRPPWSGAYENPTELYARIMATDPDFVPSEWLDAGLCLIAHRLLRKDPSRRPSINELLFSPVFEEFGGWESVQDYSKPGPLRPKQLSRGKKLKEFWPGYEYERDQATDTDPSFNFTDSGILNEIEEQRAISSASQPVGVLRRTKGQTISRVRPLLTRINTSGIPPAIPQAESVPRISSATSCGSIDIPEVEEHSQMSPKMDDDPLANLFPSLANLYLVDSIHPHPSPVPYEAVPLVAPPPLSEVSSRLPSSEATSIHSSDRYFSSTDSLGDIASSTSTTPLTGLSASKRTSSKSKRKGRYGVEWKLVSWVRGFWGRRRFGGLIS